MKIRILITKYWPLIVILLVAAVLRLWKLGSIPPHLTPDEASLGYNAYSILKTGRDEYGEILPIIFKSFGDYKPGLYVYLTVPFVAILGLTEVAVRLPSAIAGVVAVWLLYKIVLLLFVKQNNRLPITDHRLLAIIAAFMLAISPWHIHFSRGAWEVNVALTLSLAGIYFFLRSLKKSKYLYLSAVFFALTLITYQGAKLSTVIVLLILALVFWKEFLKLDKKVIAASLILGLILILPVILSLFQGRVGRLEVYSVFSYSRPTGYTQQFLDQGAETVSGLSYYLFHSEPLNFARGILGRWFNHYSGRFLFFEGDWKNPRHSVPNHGTLFLSDFVLLIVGLSVLFKFRNSKAVWFTVLWLFLAPLPAVLSRDQVQAVRAYNLVIPLTIVLSLGLYWVLKWIKDLPARGIRYISFSLLITIYCLLFTYFIDLYFIHLPVHDAKHWNYGYKQTVEEITLIQSKYDKIVFQQSYNQPYIYFLFYQKYNPDKYQKQAKLVEGGIDVGLVEKLDNIHFTRFSWPHATGEKGLLLAGDSVGIPTEFFKDSYSLIKEIKYPDNFMTAFRIVEAK
jgi:4-amino-4-deoxy-L-arabinose transferase-like glycosyltransferase